MSETEGLIKKLRLHELVGHDSEEDINVYPITALSAIIDETTGKSLAEIISSLSGGDSSLLGISTKLVQVYKTSSARPSTPEGGGYDFTANTLTAPDGWSVSSEGLEEPVWMSYGSAVSNLDTITWSIPICIAGNLGSAAVTKCYVAIVYKNAEEQPDAPTGGTYDFTASTFTPPDGWTVNAETSTGDETVWCSIRAFYSDDTETSWSTPNKASQSTISLTAAQIQAIADQISITANMLRYIATKVTLNATDLEAIAKNVTLTTDQLSVIAEYVDITGTLSTRDLTINGGKSQFNADGSGYVANENLKWDADGNLTINGNLNGVVTADLLYGKTIDVTNELSYNIDLENNPATTFLYHNVNSTTSGTRTIYLPKASDYDGIEINILVAIELALSATNNFTEVHVGLQNSSDNLYYEESLISLGTTLGSYFDSSVDTTSLDDIYVKNYNSTVQAMLASYTLKLRNGSYKFKSINGSWWCIEGAFTANDSTTVEA